MSEDKQELASPINEERLFPVLSVLKEDDANAILALKTDLQDTWVKKQIFRTETEMRVSVLNDGSFATPAAKYWQSVREQSAMLDNLISMSFDMRRNEIKRLKLLKKLEETEDELDRKEIEIDLDENLFGKAAMDQTAKDRVREIKKWAEIKAELNDGTFDAMNPNTHQAESLHHRLAYRASALNENSDPTEISNVMGQLQTMERLKQQNLLTHEAVVAQKQLTQQPVPPQQPA
jgi:hypothetical protein